MTKQELVDKVKSMGYETGIEEGIPFIYNLPYPKADKIIKELGYKGSYGVKRKE